MFEAASLDYLRTRAIRLAQRLSPGTSPVDTVRAEMRGGVMEGLHADVDGMGFSMGGAEDNDIVLLDPTVEDIRLRVTSRRSVIGALVHLSSDQPGVTVSASPIDSTGVWERLPCNIDLAGVPLTLDRADRRDGMASVGFAYIGIVAIAAIALVLFPPSTTRHAVTPPVAADTRVETPADATELAQLIETAGLGPYLDVSQGSGDTLRVSGRVPDARMGAWRDLRMAWDARTNTPPLVSRVAKMKGLERLPPIAAVHLGDRPYILLADGQNIAPGDTLTDGWTVTEIRRSSFLLTRNGEDIDITF